MTKKHRHNLKTKGENASGLRCGPPMWLNKQMKRVNSKKRPEDGPVKKTAGTEKGKTRAKA